VTQNDEKFGTAGYLAEIHPQQVEQIEEQLEQLNDSNPVKVSLGIVLGMSMYVDVAFCRECGAIVHDKDQHLRWHLQVEVPR
jgi:hypothetical protein